MSRDKKTPDFLGLLIFWVLAILTQKNGWLAASDPFLMFTQLIKFYRFYYHILKVQMLEKGESSNRQQKLMVSPFCNIYGKIWVGFYVLTLGIAFFRASVFELTERA